MTQDQKPAQQRPLSPHLQVYRLPLTALMSISHRASGIFLAFGSLFIAAWIIAAGMGQTYYDMFMSFAQSGLGTLLLFGWSVALYYHLCNGLRHMLWDMGAGLNEKCANRGSVMVLIMTLILTAATWYCATYYI